MAVEEGYGARQRPTYAAILTQDPVLELKDPLVSNGRANGGEDGRLIVRENVGFEPRFACLIGIDNKLAP